MKLDAGQVSYEFIREHYKTLDKFEQLKSLVGFRYAEQSIRAIRRLHTFYSNQRGELDNTKYGIYLYPNSNYSNPLFFYTCLGADHTSGVIKGESVTIAPSSASTIRLYKSCVMPKALVLPDGLRHYAHDWDVAGTDTLVAVDNGPEMRSRHVGLMFLMLWVILLFMPPKRGDMKGSIERLFQTLEGKFMSTLPGYVNAKGIRATDPRSERIRARAMANANMTVAEYRKKLIPIILEYNQSKHPRFNRPRIEVYREAQSLVPLVLPTGRRQLQAIFSLTYTPKLTREGVEVERLKYQSDELSMLYRVYSGKVHVKLDPDDIRTVLVFAPKVRDPIEAHLTTLDIDDFSVTLELARTISSRIPISVPREEFGFHFLHELQTLQSGKTILKSGETWQHLAQAAAHAADVPTVEYPSENTESTTELNSLLEGTDLPDDE